MRRIVLTFLYSLAVGACFAQAPENNRYLLPSPTAASLGKYGDYPLSLYTGNVAVGLPIYTVKSGKLSLPVSLSYNTSGNRPSDVPGWVGLGWSLNAGGVITRTSNDLPDDSNGGVVGVGYYYGGTAFKNQYDKVAGPDNDYRHDHIERRVDVKPDIFYFNFDGKAGKFSFDHTGTIQFYGRERFKVTVSIGSGSHGVANYFDSFVITANDGIKYTFAQKEWSLSSIGKFNEPANFVSSWYLTNIQHPTGDNIQLNYTASSSSIRVKAATSQKFIFGYVGSPSEQVSVNDNGVNTSVDEVVYLDEIVFANGKLTFPKSVRHDVAYRPSVYVSYDMEKKLDQIVLKTVTDEVKKSWSFNYIDNSGERLKLSSVKEKGIDGLEVLLASYQYNPQLFPFYGAGADINNFDTSAIDYWGYYNMASNNSKIPVTFIPGINGYRGDAIRTINETGMKAEILEKITYPTGGYTAFEFEPHDYSVQGEGFFEPFDYSWGQEVWFQYEGGHFEQDPETLTFTLTERSLIETKTSCQAVYGPNSQWCGLDQQIKRYELDPGTYNLKDLFHLDVLAGPYSTDIDIANGYVKVRSKIPVTRRQAGGLRIKSVTNNDGIQSYVKRYKYNAPADSNLSTGILSKFPQHYVEMNTLWPLVHGMWLSSESIEPMPDGPAIGYGLVTEILENGSKIKHHYSTYAGNGDDRGTDFSGLENRMAALISQNHWRGLELKTEYLSVSNIKVKEISNHYLEDQNTKFDIPAFEERMGFLYDGPTLPSYFAYPSKYHVPCRFIYKSSATVTDFDINGQNPVRDSTIYYFDNPEHLQNTRTVTAKSNGKLITSLTTFPEDYQAGTPFIDALKTANLTSIPIEKVSFQSENNIISILDAQLFRYKLGGKGLLDTLYVLENQSPVELAAFKFSDRSTGQLPYGGTPGVFGFDNRYRKKLIYDSFDIYGNPLTIRAEQGTSTGYKWAYNFSLPIAECKNASSSEFYFEGFEEIAGSVAGNSHTGSKFSTNTNVVWTKPNIKDYTITFWYRNSGKWLFKQQNYYGNSFVLTGGDAYDDISIFPSDAQMQTFCYDPIFGMTSKTDAKGNTSYFEYDSLGRLTFLKDSDGNILENIGYHYKQ